jgi:hypothetical protein
MNWEDIVKKEDDITIDSLFDTPRKEGEDSFRRSKEGKIMLEKAEDLLKKVSKRVKNITDKKHMKDIISSLESALYVLPPPKIITRKKEMIK